MLLTISFIIVSLLGLAMMAYLIHIIKGLSENITEITSRTATIDNKLGTVTDEGKVLGLLNKAATHAKNCSTALLEHTRNGIDTISAQISTIGTDIKDAIKPTLDTMGGHVGEVLESVNDLRSRKEWEHKRIGLAYPECPEGELHDTMVDGAKFLAELAIEAENAYNEMTGREKPSHDGHIAPDDDTTWEHKDEPAEEEGATTAER